MGQKGMLFWVWLAERLGAANRDFPKLIAMYGNPYELFHAEEGELERIEGIHSRTAELLSNKSLDAATKILDTCERLGIGILPYGDRNYPLSLRELRDPPIVLYYTGELLEFSDLLCIGMVGTRRMSEYGLGRAYKLSYEIAAAGAAIVSGMAAGIDGVCAAAALAAGGKTVAVLGCGLDVVYPKHHRRLMGEIAKRGLIVSEYPPGTPPNHYQFPVRNRIISGLSQGTVVIEAGIGSGSLITARNAILQGKDVFTVPANIDSPGAEGTNGLLRDGAHPVLESEDVLRRYRGLYGDVLKRDVFGDAARASRVNLQYLADLGVIELTNPVPSGTERTGAVPEQKEKPKRTAKRSTSKESQPTAEPRVEASAKNEAAKKPTPDDVLKSLTSIQVEILEAMPDDRAITVDALAGMGFPYGDLIAALTMLEILGLIQKLPGALYMKT
ncbi:MAG: DNA-processing protein DprA [Clostridia bacterium]|nr:DNA-processing protein DprA [Clostridia bacterium]